MPNALFFIDYANIDRMANKMGIELDYGHLRNYVALNKELLDAFCYFPIDPRNEHGRDGEIELLQNAGYFITSKVGTYAGNSYKCNMDVEIAIDIMRMAYIIKPNVIILATGDGDFIPVINELRKLGISAEIAAFKSTMSRQLYLRASRVIDLQKYHDENTGKVGFLKKIV